jgi:hypothetical protein
MVKAARAGAIATPSAPTRSALQTPWRIAFVPLARVPAQYSINYNEGFTTQMAHMAHMAISGARLYGAPPQFVYTTYPPLSFYVIGVLGAIG